MVNRSSYRSQSTTSGDLTNKDALESVSLYYQKRNAAVGAAKKLSDHEEELSQSAVQNTYRENPYIVQDSDSALTSEGQDKFLQEVLSYIRIIEYCLLSGSSQPLDDFLPGRREYYRAINHAPSWYVSSLQYIKANHHLEQGELLEANSYIDYAISALS